MSSLRVFISAAQTELRNERVHCRDVLKQHGLHPVLFEDEPASPEPPEAWWRARVAEADVYIGIFWNEFSQPTASEYLAAVELKRPAFVFVKQFDAARRDSRLVQLLEEMSGNLKYQPFQDTGELGAAVWTSVLDWMVAQAHTKAGPVLPAAIRSALTSRIPAIGPLPQEKPRSTEAPRPADLSPRTATGDVIIGATSSPAVFLGRANQQTAVVSIAELQAGALGGSAEGSMIRLCLVDLFDRHKRSDDRYTAPPFLVVTSGDLKIASHGAGNAIADSRPASSVEGRIRPEDQTCVEWVIYSPSTVASTVEVRGADVGRTPLPAGATNGPAIDVSPHNRPGPMVMSAYVVDADGSTLRDLGLIPAAQRVWTTRNGVPGSAAVDSSDPIRAAMMDFAQGVPVLVALAAPLLVRGGEGQRGGGVVLSETAPDQLLHLCGLLGHEGAVFAEVLLELDPTAESGVRFDIRFEPIVSTNSASSGCLASFAGFEGERTLRIAVWPSALTQTRHGSALGSVNVSDLYYTVPHDAPTGDVKLAARLRGALVVDSPATSGLRGVVTAPFAPDARPSPQVIVNARVK